MSFSKLGNSQFLECPVWVSTQAKALLKAKADSNNRRQARQFNNDDLIKFRCHISSFRCQKTRVSGWNRLKPDQSLLISNFLVILPLGCTSKGAKKRVLIENKHEDVDDDDGDDDDDVDAAENVMIIFFPSCASVALARSSYIVVLIERITQMHTYPSLGFESEARTT